MNEQLRKVKEFHELFKLNINESPTIIDQKRFNLRVALQEEELDEMQEAYIQKDKIELLDSLADQMYILNGTIIELGLQNVFDEAFSRVHESNMSKACITIEEAENTVLYYKETRHVEAYYVESNGEFLVYRTEDNKALKSINYQKVNLTDLV